MATSKKEARKSALKEMLAGRFKNKAGSSSKDKFSSLKKGLKESKKEEAAEQD